MKTIAGVLLLTLFFISRGFAASPYSATGTFTADITAGTCTVVATDSSGNTTNNINIGDVYISELQNKVHVTPFNLKFTNCLGISKITVSTASSTCAGNNTDAFGAISGSKAANVGLEVWMGNVDGSNQFHCGNPGSNNNKINLSSTPVVKATSYTQAMSARPIVTSGYKISDVVAGNASYTVNFTFTYE